MIRTRRVAEVVAALTLLQALVFYDHFATALTVLFALGLGVWLRRWTAAGWAFASFAVAFLAAALTGWMDDPRAWDFVLGGALALLGGAIGGGIFDLLRRDEAARAERAAV